MKSSIFFGLIYGFGLGLPGAKLVNQMSDSPLDIYNFNVYYDLATLYGDKNGDKVLSQEEFQDFNIKELIPKVVFDGDDTTFKFLGCLPDDSNMYIYVYTDTQISSTYIDEGDYIYSSSGWDYFLRYYNYPDIENYDEQKVASLKYLNEIAISDEDKTCYFSKLVLEKYDDGRLEEKKIEGTDNYFLRFTPTKLEISYKNNDKYSKKIENFDFIYSSDLDIKRDNTLFSDKTYSISTSVIDGMLLYKEQNSYSQRHVYTFIPMPNSDDSYVEECYELYYYFFNFDNFNPDEVLKVGYQYTDLSWNFVNYYTYKQTTIKSGMISNTTTEIKNKGVVDYTFDECIQNKKDTANDEEYKRSNVIDITRQTRKGVIEQKEYILDQNDKYSGWFKHDVIKRKSNIKTIVNLKNLREGKDSINTVYKDSSNSEIDMNENLRNFLLGNNSNTSLYESFYNNTDHSKYDYAFLINQDNWIRKSSYGEELHRESWNTGPSLAISENGYKSYVRQIISCHQPEDVLVLWMRVRDGINEYDINIISNPETVRKNYMVGYQAPTLLDFVKNDISNWFSKFSWIIWIIIIVVALIILAILGIVLKPVGTVLKYVGKALLGGIKLVLNICYLLLIYWWLALIKKARQEELPPKWIFKKK